ncbi:MerR family transcriptional regulator [Kutzneria chonburiensis]|uniref:MerR family transcriptional regulator n=1 Tax=Kutzneria chonburiensis TaxID=1483604 RepID=A0ABV6MWI8_9PSEU|nr:MerR family transcriptional regulator [Kutzneria chonburiensis]
MTDDYTVGTAAELAGVSVRTLHHYDQIGLVKPSRRSDAGYRLYSDADVQALNRAVFYRELGLELGEIAELLADNAITDEDHLQRQRELLTEQISRFTAMVTVIDKELAARAAGIGLTPRQRREVFGQDFVAHADEAARKWGNSKEFVQRKQRTARYIQQDWTRLRTELAAINKGLAEAMINGLPPTDPKAMDLAERHRKHTDRWFHDCDHATHRELAEHYRNNERSGQNYDEMVPGLSRYVHDAIVANAERSA